MITLESLQSFIPSPINHFPLASFIELSVGFHIPVHVSGLIGHQKYNNHLPFVPSRPSSRLFRGAEPTQASIKVCFSIINRPRRLVKEEEKERISRLTLKKRRVLHLALSGGLLTWRNICCMEIKTDDSVT